jgi:hypothetical protein
VAEPPAFMLRFDPRSMLILRGDRTELRRIADAIHRAIEVGEAETDRFVLGFDVVRVVRRDKEDG